MYSMLASRFAFKRVLGSSINTNYLFQPRHSFPQLRNPQQSQQQRFNFSTTTEPVVTPPPTKAPGDISPTLHYPITAAEKAAATAATKSVPISKTQDPAELVNQTSSLLLRHESKITAVSIIGAIWLATLVTQQIKAEYDSGEMLE